MQKLWMGGNPAHNDFILFCISVMFVLRCCPPGRAHSVWNVAPALVVEVGCYTHQLGTDIVKIPQRLHQSDLVGRLLFK